MSQDNVDVVRRGYEALARGDMEGLAVLFQEHLHPDFEYRSQLAGESYRGVEGALAWLNGVREAFQGYTVEIEDVMDSGEHVLVVSRQRGRGAGSGVPIEWPISIVWTFDDDGRAVHGMGFSSRADALEAVGLAE